MASWSLASQDDRPATAYVAAEGSQGIGGILRRPCTVPGLCLSATLAPAPLEEGFDLARWRTECEEELAKYRARARRPRGGLGSARLTPLSWELTSPSLPPEERAQISEAIFSKQDPLLHTVCRGNMAAVLSFRAGCAAQSARERRRRHVEVGEEHRWRAVQWRRRREAAARGRAGDLSRTGTEGNGGLAALGGAETDESSSVHGLGPEGVSPQGGAPESAEDEGGQLADWRERRKTKPSKKSGRWRGARRSRRKRLAELPPAEREAQAEAFGLYAVGETSLLPVEDLLRCLMELGLAGSTRHERWAVDRMCSSVYCALVGEEGLGNQFRRLSSLSQEKPTSGGGHHLRKLSTASEDRPTSGSGGGHQLRKLSTAGEDGSGSYFRRMSSSQDGFRRRISKTPQEQFALPAGGGQPGAPPSRRTSAVNEKSIASLAAKDSIAGWHRRTAGLEAVAEDGPAIADALMKVAAREQQDHLRVSSRTSMQDHRFKARKSCAVNNSNYVGHTITMKTQMPISFEDFSTEIVPAVRQQLDDIRQEVHFAEFVRYLDRCGPDAVVLTPEQFLTASERKSLDSASASKALEEMGFGVESASLGGQKPEEFGVDQEAWHDLFMIVEEHTARKRRKFERELKTRTGMADTMFWRYRNDLIRFHGTFGLYDEDGDGSLKRSEVKQLFKHLGFEPYRKGDEAAVVEDLLAESDASKDGRLDLFSFLKLMERTRAVQREQRHSQLSQVFRNFTSDIVRRVDFKHIWKLLQSAEIWGKPSPNGPGSTDHAAKWDLEDEEAVHQVLEEFDTDASGEISFTEFEDLAQRVHETVCGRQAERIVRQARGLGMSMEAFAECQWAFDQLDTDGSGGLSPVEIKEAFQMQLAREPSMAEVRMVYDECGICLDDEVRLPLFLRLTKCASEHLIQTDFCLKNVPARKLRECLLFFPLAKNYVSKLEPEELVDTVGTYLDLDPSADLTKTSDRTPTVCSVRQLLEFARKKAQSWLATEAAVTPQPA